MSLKVWLPLNGNFNNQGLGKFDTEMKQTNVVFEPGKIGNNPIFSADATNYITCQELIGAFTFTICFFIKATDNQTFTTWSDVFNATNFRVEFNSTSGNAINLFGFGYDNSGLGQIYINKEWHHIVYTYKDNTFTGYCDGIQKVKRTVQTPGTIWSGKFRLGDSANSYFQLADFRIYDECLTQKQIKEIAKGLVCHYKMTMPNINENLLLESNSPNRKYNTTSYPCGTYNLKQSVVNGKQYTFSIKVTIEKAYKIGFYFGGGSYTPGWLTFPDSDGTFVITQTFTANANQAAQSFINVYVRDSQDTPAMGKAKCIIHWIKLERENQATGYVNDAFRQDESITTDDSGYNYIGTQYGTLAYNQNSPKYDRSTSFDNGYLHYLPSPLYSTTDSFTIATWFYPTQNATMALYNNRTAVGLGVSVFYINGKIRFDTGGNAHQTTFNNSTLTVNAWNHIAVTYERGIAKKCYLNGILVGTETTNVGDLSNIGINASIGNSSTNAAAGAGNQIYGSLSDFRIYATALSAEEILTLYKNSGIIDNNNSVYTREFKEV